MNTKPRVGAFVGIAFALMIPYFAFIVYFAIRLPVNHAPVWFTNTVGIWFVVNFCVLAFLAKRMFKGQGIGENQFTLGRATTKRGTWIIRSWGSYLVLVWVVLFIVGVKGTIEGKYALSRAIPAGAFLLFFIGIFGRSIHRTFRPKI
jgi:hypothetical protein